MVRALKGNLLWHWSQFFLDQTGEINFHMVFPQYQILFKCLFETSNGGACWERWNTSPLWMEAVQHTNTGSPLGLPKHRLECRCQVRYKALERNLAARNSTLNPDPVYFWPIRRSLALAPPNLMLSSDGSQTAECQISEQTVDKKIWSVVNNGAPLRALTLIGVCAKVCRAVHRGRSWSAVVGNPCVAVM